MSASTSRHSIPATAFDRAHLRQMKLNAMLDEAALLFNENGYAGTNLETLSRRLGVSKRTIYNYTKNKEELAYECYRRTSRYAQECLQTACMLPGDSLTRLRAFVRGSLSEANPPLAVQTELHVLTPERRGEFLEEAREIRARLTDLIVAGLAEGSIARCDPKVAAFAIFSIVAWVPMWFSRTGRASLDEVGQAFDDLITYGLAAGPRAIDGVSHRMSSPSGADLQPFDRAQVGTLKQTTLVKAATALFNTRGVAGTSLDDVADSLCVTKGTLYYYFENKEELLLRCYERTLELAENYTARIVEQATSPLESIELGLRCCIDTHTGDQGPVMIFVGLDNLSPDVRRQVVARARLLERGFGSAVSEGIADGSVRNIDPVLARFALAGALDWFPKWYRPEGASSPRDIADCFVQLFLNGLTPREPNQ